MSRTIKHILIPSLAPAIIIGLYFTPVSLIGCANRGLAAIAVVFIALIAGIASAIQAHRTKARGDDSSSWWILSALILTLPAVLVLGPLR